MFVSYGFYFTVSEVKMQICSFTFQIASKFCQHCEYIYICISSQRKNKRKTGPASILAKGVDSLTKAPWCPFTARVTAPSIQRPQRNVKVTRSCPSAHPGPWLDAESALRWNDGPCRLACTLSHALCPLGATSLDSSPRGAGRRSAPLQDLISQSTKALHRWRCSATTHTVLSGPFLTGASLTLLVHHPLVLGDGQSPAASSDTRMKWLKLSITSYCTT